MSALCSSEMKEVSWNDRHIHACCPKFLKLLHGVPTTGTCHSMEMWVPPSCAHFGTNTQRVILLLQLCSILYLIIICKSTSIQSQLFMSLSTRHRPSPLPFLFHTGDRGLLLPLTPSCSECGCFPWHICQNCNIVVELKPNGRDIEARLLWN